MHDVLLALRSFLFRRFLPGGQKSFHHTLLLESLTWKNLVLVATDVQGGRAVSFVRWAFKGGTRGWVSYCGDHVNDCSSLCLGTDRIRC